VSLRGCILRAYFCSSSCSGAELEAPSAAATLCLEGSVCMVEAQALSGAA
jgi:hypothetical protein